MAAKRKPAAQMRKIRDLDEPLEVIHESQGPAATPAPVAAAPVPEADAPIAAAPEAGNPADVEPVAPAEPVTGFAPIPQSGLSNVKSKVKTLRCQSNLDLIISENAAHHGLTTSSFLNMAVLYLHQQEEKTVEAAWKLLREVEAGWSDGTSPVRQIRQSPRFINEILVPLAGNPIFANNQSQAIKAAAAWISAMSRSDADRVVFSLRVYDGRNGYDLTENARTRRT